MKAGAQVGPYEMISTLGSGGMGEVFRARDTRLNRDVAVKVLPKDFASDADRLRRFEQEAKTLAALNHPNVLTIHDAGVHEGAPYLVSELLEGQTLREVLGSAANAALPVRKATEYALQIAQGLAAAHSKGVIHRDLKPENIYVTKDGRVKILDFGLAKLHSGGMRSTASLEKGEVRDAVERVPPGHADAPTLLQSTEPGMVLGTPAYMSPEQVRGEPADHRADIFAFGCVLYEMLSGTRAFRRDTPVASMNAVLSEEPPPLSVNNASISPPLERIVHRCLEKQPDNRFQSAKDLTFAIENPRAVTTTVFGRSVGGADSRRGLARLFPWSVTAAAILFAIAISLSVRHRPGSGQTRDGKANLVRKFELSFPATGKKGLELPIRVLISPDGSKLVYADLEGLRLSRLDRADAPGFLRVAAGAQLPFWSPDSTEVAFFENRKLYRVPVDGGQPRLVCNVSNMDDDSSAGGGAWLRDGRILFTTGGTGLYEVSAKGGSATLALAPGEGEKDFHDPNPLPDGLGVLFVVHLSEKGKGGWKLAVWRGRGTDKQILPTEVKSLVWRPVYSPSGHVLFSADGLWALPFSPTTFQATGKTFRIAEDWQSATVARDGTLVLSQKEIGRFAARQLVWVDRSGKIVGSLGPPMRGLHSPRISPDQQRIAFAAGESWSELGVWVIERSRETPVRATPQTLTLSWVPFWLPSGRELLFTRGTQTLAGSAEGGGTPETIFSRSTVDLSEGGKYALLLSWDSSDRWSYGRISTRGDAPVSFPEYLQRMRQPTLSPDDTWLAYVSDDSGRRDVYTAAFPGLTNRIIVSRNGGREPRWHPKGNELFFLSLDGGALMSAKVQTDLGKGFQEPKNLFEMPKLISLSGDERTKSFDVTSDGEHFLMMQRVEEESALRPQSKPNVLVVENWFEEFRDKK